jgi:transposase
MAHGKVKDTAKSNSNNARKEKATTTATAQRQQIDAAPPSLAPSHSAPTRYIGIDTHKAYLLAYGIDPEQTIVYGPRKVPLEQLSDWIASDLTAGDAVVVEMTLNTWTLHDALLPNVHSVTVVHPPHVKLITRASVKTDKRAALALAQLHCAGLLPSVWVPPAEVRDLRALVAQRSKMKRLASQSMCRLHAVLHRLAIPAPEGIDLFRKESRSWWESLPVSSVERFRLCSDLDTLAFAKEQVLHLERALGALAAQDERTPLLAQVPGVGALSAIQILATIGDIGRFPSARQLVGYAGLGTRVHESGQLHWSGRISKQGRKDLRWILVQCAHSAIGHHPYWKAEHARHAKRIGSQKATVAVARRLLVTIWHVLTKGVADTHADTIDVARSLFRLVYRMGVRNPPKGTTALTFTRDNLDRLGIGANLTYIPSGNGKPQLPPLELRG